MECKNCGNENVLVGVGTENRGMCPVCGSEQELDDEGGTETDELENEILAFNRFSLITKSDKIREMPVRTEADLKLKVAEVVYRVGKIVFNSAMKKYTAELKRNLTGQVIVAEQKAGLDLNAIRWAGL